MEEFNETMAKVDEQAQQPPTTTIVSSMATLSRVAPITQSEMDEFETDPKWEMTTLEKASFDDIHLETSLDNNSQTPQSGSNGNLAPASNQQLMPIEEQSKNSNLTESEATNIQLAQLVAKQTEDKETPTIAKPVSHQQEPTPADNSNKHECFISLHSIMKGTTNETLPNLEITAHSVNNHQQPVSNTSVKLVEPASQYHDRSELDKANTHVEATATTGGGIQDNNMLINQTDNQSSGVMSQSSVDAQMATVIEHVVELGGCHQFSQTLGHHEDKEKAVESIQREILGCKNPMESLAEVASQQPVLTESIAESSLASGSQDNIASEHAKIKTKNHVVGEANVSSNESSSVVESFQEDIDAEKKSISQMQPIASEVVPETREVHSVRDDERKESDAAGSSSEKAPIQGAAYNPILPSEEEEEKQETLVNDDLTSKPNLVPEEVVTIVTGKEEKATVFDQPTEHNEFQTSEKLKQDEIVGEVQVDETHSDEPAKKGPGRGRYSRRGSSRKRGRRAFTAIVVEDIVASGGDELDSLQDEDLRHMDSAKQEPSLETSIDEKPEEIFDKEEEGPPSKLEDHENKDEEKEDKQPEAEGAKEKSMCEIVVESEPSLESGSARQGRSLRVRAPKRPIEEVEKPEAQPAKKQFKRSRGQQDLNKTFDFAKKAPTIKLPVRPRATISISDPSIRPDSRYEVYDHDGGSNRKFKCNNCKYSTDRLNNIVFHHKRSNEFVSGVRCPGDLRAAEEQRAEIIRLQQTPKSNKKRARASTSSPYYNKI